MDMLDKFKNYFDSLNNVTNIITSSNIKKIISYIQQIPLLCEIDIKSSANQVLRNEHEKHYHPVKVFRGDIYITLK